MNTTTITFNPNGTASCLYTELIDLHSLGSLEVTRASQIEFNNDTQQWEVKDLTGQVLFSHAQRKECIEWEHQNLRL
jgi:hypothetical protein